MATATGSGLAKRGTGMARAKAAGAALARRGAGAAAKLVQDEKHTTAALLAAAGLGLAEKQGIALPRPLGFLSVAGNYGLAAWVIGRTMKNRTASHVATGLLSIAVYQMAKGGGVSGDDGDIVGEL